MGEKIKTKISLNPLEFNFIPGEDREADIQYLQQLMNRASANVERANYQLRLIFVYLFLALTALAIVLRFV